jgi:dihydropteroate synthase
MAFVLKNPAVMGILNITPDSFSDGGKFFSSNKINLDLVLKQAEQMARDGAVFLDVGGESTRPGAQKISVQEELDRVIPAIEKIKQNMDVIISVDTSKAEVMDAAARAGAGLINDVCALQTEKAMEVAAASGLPVCLMHMQGTPQTMQQAPIYTDVLEEVKIFLGLRIKACVAAGINKDKLLVDPGFGFGKTLEHNLTLINQLGALQDLGCPILVGLSRKSMISKITGDNDVRHRLPGSLALAWACVEQGAKIVRAHDVKATVDMLKIYQALNNPFGFAQGAD